MDFMRAAFSIVLFGSLLGSSCGERAVELSGDEFGSFVLVPAGSFVMGSPSEELGHVDSEVQHRVTLTRSFFVRRTEVTQASWLKLMGNNPSFFSLDGEGDDCGLDCPVETVSWYDALAYCNASSVLESLEPCYDLSGCIGTPGLDFECPDTLSFSLDCAGYRLPTEAEWEYTYRAGTTSAFYAGDITQMDSTLIDPVLDAIGWYGGNSDGVPHPVALKQPNGWGIYDLAGNVTEWTWDMYGGYTSAPTIDPIGAASDKYRAPRGGSWFSPPISCRAAVHFSYKPHFRLESLGFRPVRTCLECESVVSVASP